jgi:hypothetical protein
MRFRCMNCHSEGTPQSRKLVQKHGERVAWMKSAGPEATLEYLRSTDLIDLKSPEKSTLLLKPLNEVEHGGGRKFQRGDQAFRAYLDFLEDYARTVGNRYTDAGSLPKPAATVHFGTDSWLKLTGVPEAWGGQLLQVNVHAWDNQKGAWETDPIATSDRAVAPRGGLWQHVLTLLASRGSERARAWKGNKQVLPPGRHRIKIHVDANGRLATDSRAVLDESDFVGAVEVNTAWPEGYGRMTSVDLRNMQH